MILFIKRQTAKEENRNKYAQSKYKINMPLFTKEGIGKKKKRRNHSPNI